MAQYWLSRWLDFHNVTSEAEAEKALASPTVVSDLRKFARKASRSLESPIDSSYSVVAGRGIDLSGQLDCPSDTCRVRQIDQLFSHVWHYFDRIVVQDGVAHEINFHWDDTPNITRRRLLSHIKVVLYLRAIGAEDLVDFRVKSPPCTVHLERHANDAGILEIEEQVQWLADFLLQDAKISFKVGSGDVTNYRLLHPLINTVAIGSLDPLSIGDIGGPIQRKVAVLVARRFIAYLTSDMSASSRYGGALGAVNGIHGVMLRKLRGTTPEDVLINLQLPVLQGLQPWDLIDIRREEGQYFASFRDSLLEATKERLKLSGRDSATQIAEEIRLDVIEPQLNTITLRLKSAQKVLTKKCAVGLVLGSLSTTCGLLTGFSPEIAIAGGTAVAISCTGAATAKYIDDLKDISLNDMFFLWRAREHTNHSRS